MPLYVLLHILHDKPGLLGVLLTSLFYDAEFKVLVMGGAFKAAVYDFTPIYSRLWQSVSMAVGYPVCGTANPCLFQ